MMNELVKTGKPIVALGPAVSKRTYKAYRSLLSSPRWQRIYNAGARPQRLLWASTGTKDPLASDVLYIRALAAPFTVNTMPEGTLKALADHGDIPSLMRADGGNCEEVLTQFAAAGIDIHALARQLQTDAADSFVKSWNELMRVITSKGATLNQGELGMKRPLKVLAIDIGGGNAKKLKQAPPGCRVGANANVFVGGFRMWEKAGSKQPSQRATARKAKKPPVRKLAAVQDAKIAAIEKAS